MTDIKAPALPYTVHANFHHYRKKLGAWRLILAFALTLLIFLRFGLTAWIISLVVIVAILALAFFALVKRSVTINEDSVEYRNMLGQRIVMNLSDIESAKVFINFYDASFGATPRVSIAEKSEKKPIVLIGLYWKLEDVDKLLAALKEKKVPVEYYEDMVAYGDVAKAFPKYATYLERHTGRVALIASAVMIAVVVAIAMLITFVW